MPATAPLRHLKECRRRKCNTGEIPHATLRKSICILEEKVLAKNRKGIDGLAMIIGDQYGQNPFEKGTLFLFCGKRSDRCKGLLWMGTGFLLLYKRFENGRMSWPRNTQEAADLTEEQFHYLMMGLNPLDLRVKEVAPEKIY